MTAQLLLEREHVAPDIEHAEGQAEPGLIGRATVAAFMDWWWLAEPTTGTDS